MNRTASSLAAGVTGAVTITVLHEVTRHVVPNAPRVDLLGMQGISRMFRGAAPRGNELFAATLVADIVSNAAYYSLAARSRAHGERWAVALGVAAGVGAVVLPGPLAFDEKTTARTPLTAVLTIALYTAGGIAAAMALRKLRT